MNTLDAWIKRFYAIAGQMENDFPEWALKELIIEIEREYVNYYDPDGAIFRARAKM